MSQASEVEAVSPLTREQQAQVVKHDWLVASVVHKYARSGSGVSVDDLMAEGNLGLCFAAAKFDESRGLKFSTYAVHWVRARVLDYLVRNHCQVRFGTRRDDRKVFFRLGRANRLFNENDKAGIAEYIGVDVDTFETAKVRLSRKDVSLDAPRSADDGRAFALPIEATQEHELVEAETSIRERDRFAQALKQLDWQERLIIKKRHLVDVPRTLRELGEELGIARERVRQLELRAVGKLRTLVAGQRVKPARKVPRPAERSLCLSCGKERRAAGRLFCSPCLVAKRRAVGLCTRCGRRLKQLPEGAELCARCG